MKDAPLVMTKGYAAPMLWGAAIGYSVDDIARGLNVDPELVAVAIETFSPVRFPQSYLRPFRLPPVVAPMRVMRRVRYAGQPGMGAGV